MLAVAGLSLSAWAGAEPSLFDAVSVGDLKLPNRIVMSPLTRSRADKERVPTDLMRTYYEQRSTAGLIIAEATSVDPMGVGYANTPGIWNAKQVAGWKKIVDGVHKAGGRIVLQLWHVGRISDPVFLDGKLPVAPSAIAPEGHVSLLRPKKPYVVPRALERKEILGIVEQFRKAAVNAKKAGFDGVEIHGANGYLPDQFLHTGTNKRTDEYGGSVENRARFLLQITDAAISVYGAGRVGVHLSPRSDSGSVSDANPLETFTHVMKELSKRKVAFAFLRSRPNGDGLEAKLKQAFTGAYIANQGITREEAASLVKKGEADLIAFGQLFISNPDLVHRLKAGEPLAEPNPKLYYTEGERGYTDYPALLTKEKK